jgi:hypothetical protein
MKRIIVIGLLVLTGMNGFSQSKKGKKNSAVIKDTVAQPAPAAIVETPTTPVVSAPAVPPLTEAQKATLKEINKEFKKTKQSIESDTTLSLSQKESQIKIASKEKSTKIKAILSPEQIEQIKQNRKKKSED